MECTFVEAVVEKFTSSAYPKISTMAMEIRLSAHIDDAIFNVDKASY
jgi:hypothetical protein